MSKATGKAKHPHNASRPTPKRVLKAIEAADEKTLELSLTPRQRAFAKEYIVDFNQTAAAIRAGYSPSYADRQGHLLTRHEGIAAYIDMLTRSKEAKIASVTPEYLIQRLTEVMNRDGVGAAIELRAIEMAMRHMGMFVDKTEITGKDGGAIQTEEIRQESEALKRQIAAMAGKSNLKVVGGNS